MSDLAVIDAETGELLPASPANLFGAQNPREVVRKAQDHADALVDVIRTKHLYKTIGGKNHILVEGWTLLGSMLGVFPVVVWTRQLEDGWEARVEARTLSGQVVGAAESQCARSEKTWANRDDYALRSMAQTRATSKALRGPLGFIVVLAGYEATPSEEMPSEPAARREVVRPEPKGKATKAQHAKLHALIADLKKKRPGTDWEALSQQIALETFRCDSRADLTVAEMSDLIEMLPTADVKF